jgi:hypothetical protein
MKRILFIMMLFVSSSIFSQQGLMKGSYTVGGNISYTSMSMEDESNNRNFFVFAPTLGYFFVNHLYLGLGLTYIYQSHGDFSNNTFGFGPSARYYFTLGKFNPFIGCNYSYNKIIDSDDRTTTSKTFVASGGSLYFVTECFAMQVSVNYSFNNINNIENNNSSEEKINIFLIRFGAEYFIF